MKRPSYFFKSILPFLIVILLSFLASIPTYLVFAVREMLSGDSSLSFPELFLSLENDTLVTQYANSIYGILALFVFGIWYHRTYVKPYRQVERTLPGGFSFHTILASVFIAVGMEFAVNLVVDTAVRIYPSWMDSYLDLMSSSGLDTLGPFLILYSVILAPIVEETVFRGLIFRTARLAVPFWIANIWQAFLFGLLHMNMLQGIYAFVCGLLLGWICHRGRGIKYSILVHILFNLFSAVYSGFFELLLTKGYYLFMVLGIALLIFGIWLFYTDFICRESDPAEDDTKDALDE